MGKKHDLKFSDLNSTSDFDKTIDGDMEEVDFNNDLKKNADLYNNILYTIVLKDRDFDLGIFPDDQGFSHSSVVLWNSIKGIPLYTDNDFKVFKIIITPEIKRDLLKSLGCGIYSLKHIPNTLSIEEVDGVSFQSGD